MFGKKKEKEAKHVSGDIETPSPNEDKEENSSKSPSSKESPSMSKLFRLIKPEQLMLFTGIFIMLGSEATNQVIPLIIAKAYDVIVNPLLNPDEKMADVNHYMLLSIVIFLVGAVGGFLRGSIFSVIGERLVARLRIQLYGSILDQDIAFFDEHKSGELVSRLGSDTTLLQGVVSQSIPEALNNVVKAVVSIVLTFVISPELAGVAVGTITLIVLLAMPLGFALSKLSKAYQDALGLAQTHSTEAIGSMRTVQSFTAEGKEKERYSRYVGDPDMFPCWFPIGKDVDSTYSVGFSKGIVTSGFFSIIFGGGFGFLYVCLWYGFYLVNKQELTLGELTAFQTYVFNIGLGLGTASSHLAKIFEGMGASGRVFYLLERTPAIPSPPKPGEPAKTPVTPESFEGEIKFDNVDFAYPSRPDIKVLNGFTLKIAPNTTTALVGSSGSGMYHFKIFVFPFLSSFMLTLSLCLSIVKENLLL